MSLVDLHFSCGSVPLLVQFRFFPRWNPSLSNFFRYFFPAFPRILVDTSMAFRSKSKSTTSLHGGTALAVPAGMLKSWRAQDSGGWEMVGILIMCLKDPLIFVDVFFLFNLILTNLYSLLWIYIYIYIYNTYIYIFTDVKVVSGISFKATRIGISPVKIGVLSNKQLGLQPTNMGIWPTNVGF